MEEECVTKDTPQSGTLNKCRRNTFSQHDYLIWSNDSLCSHNFSHHIVANRKERMENREKGY